MLTATMLNVYGNKKNPEPDGHLYFIGDQLRGLIDRSP